MVGLVIMGVYLVDIKELYVECHKRFSYKDGELIYKDHIKTIKQGFVAGNDNGKGYLHVSLLKKNYFVHRLIFLMHHQYLPDYVDHIDNDNSNNKIENLREATTSQNLFNSVISKRNKSGYKGVCWQLKRKSWRARINFNGREINLGYFDDIEVAAQITRIARLKYHGIFANNGAAK